MTSEFKKIKNNTDTRYVLETATSGGTSAGAIAYVPGGRGKVQTPRGNLLAQEEKKEAPKPRNFVAKNAKMGGAGAHKDKKKSEKQGGVKHKKPFMETLRARIDTLKSQLDEAGASPTAEGVAEATGDEPFDKMMGKITGGAGARQGVDSLNKSLTARTGSNPETALAKWGQEFIKWLEDICRNFAKQGADRISKLENLGNLDDGGETMAHWLIKVAKQSNTSGITLADIQEFSSEFNTHGMWAWQHFPIAWSQSEWQDYKDQWTGPDGYIASLGQGVAEALDSNFVGFMNKTLGQKADAPADKSTMPGFMKGAPVAGLDSMGYRSALDFGMKTLRNLTPTQKIKLAIKGEDGVVNWLANQAKKQGLLITDEGDEDTQGKFMQEDLDEVQDFLPEVFHDPAIKSWAFVLTDGEPLPKTPVAGPFKVIINPGIPGKNGYANADWKTVDTLENLPDARELAQGLAQRNPKQYVAISAANGKSAGSYWPGEGWKGVNEGVEEGSNGEYDDEAGMAQSNLHTMARAVDGLLNTIENNDDLPEWCQEKLAKAEMMVTGVWDYLLSQKEQGIDPQQDMAEVAPKGWEGTVKAMKKHKDEIDNPWALAHWMKNKGYKSHKKEDAYMESLNSMLERQLEPTMDVDTWKANFQSANPNKYHQFKNKTNDKKDRMAIAARYASIQKK